MTKQPESQFFEDLEEVDALLGEGRRARVLDRLLGILREMISTHDFDALLTYVMDQVIELTEAERGFLMLKGDDGALGCHVAHNVRREEIERAESQISHTVIEKALRTGQLIRVDDAEADQEYGDAPSVAALHLRSVMVAPLRARAESPGNKGDAVRGVIYVDNRKQASRFSAEHEEVLALFTEQAAAVIESARMSDELRGREREISDLNVRLEELVTERTAELQRTKEAHTQVVRQTSVSVSTFELDGTVSTWNTASEELFGISAEAAIGSGTLWSSLRPIGTDAGPESFITRTIAAGNVKGEYAVARPDGTIKRLLMESNLLQSPEGEPQGIVALAIDVTELRRVERMLARRNDLTDLGMVAAGVAHDFNNLLAVILGRAQIAHIAIQDPDIKTDIAVIEKAAKDGAEAVERIRSFVERRPDEEQSSFAVPDLIADVIAMTRLRWSVDASATGKTFNVFTTIEPAIPPVRGNVSQLRQALINLVLNALDAMPEGGNLELGARPIDSAVHIDVRDSGSGIPETRLNEVFEPFFTTKGKKGTGLGLSTSAGIIRGHGGTIEVDSKVGEGTVFKISLPAAIETGETAPELAEKRKPLIALLVDEDSHVSGVLARMLQLHGCETDQADSRPSALERFDPTEHELVFIDLEMAKCSAVELAATIKESNGDVLVVFTTGLSVVEPVDAPAHGDLLLTKPFRIPDIKELLDHVRSRSI